MTSTRKICVGAGLLTLVAGVAATTLAVAPSLASTSTSPNSGRSGLAGAVAAGPRVPVLHWRACDNGFQCATARVPLNYRHPRGELISIAVVRHLATDPTHRVGTLFVNGGGPAEQIEGFLAEFPSLPTVLRADFNLVTFDPRGFGFSTAIRCFPSLAAENRLLAPVMPYPTFPVGTKQTQQFERTYAQFDARCKAGDQELIDHDTTADEARDMNLLRLALGARRLNYVGLSYGTGLGAVYANLFPAHVGRMVLDGNLSPVVWTRGGAVPSFVREGDASNFARQTRAFLSLCGRRPVNRCAFSAGSAVATRAKFATLLQRLRAKPVQIGGQTFGYAAAFSIVPPGDVSDWQPAATQLQELWAATSSSAAAGPGGQIARTPTSATTASPYLGLEQSFGVLCSDTADPRNFGDYVAAAGKLGARFGGFGRLAAWMEAPCADWPRAANQDRYTGPWNRPTANTILVIGNTGDPTTPYKSSVAMARDLARARLLTVKGFGHTEFFNPSVCASTYEFRYLITGKLPPPGTVCPQTVKPFPAS